MQKEKKFMSLSITLDEKEMEKLGISGEEGAIRAIHELIANKGKIQTQTPVGIIQANVIPDNEYPGIALELFRNDGGGCPGTVLEYTPVEKCAQLRVYGKDTPDEEPIQIYPMSEKPDWIETDPDSVQLCRKVKNRVYELYQVQKISDPCVVSEDDRYAIAHDIVDLDDLSEKYIESLLSCYSYESMDDLREKYGCEAMQILAECSFEQDAMCHGNLLALPEDKEDGYTWEEAKEKIYRMARYTERVA